MRHHTPENSEISLREAMGDEVGPDSGSYNDVLDFSAAMFAAGLVAALALPIFLLMFWPLTPWEWAAVAWALSHLGLAILPTFGISLGNAKIAEMISLSGFLTFLAIVTGGISSIMIAWFLVIPAQAAISGSQKAILGAIAMAATSLGIVLAFSSWGWLPTSSVSTDMAPTLTAMATILAVVYAGALYFSNLKRTQKSQKRALIDEARYRFLSDHARDIIVRYRSDGSMAFVSPASADILGFSPSEIMSQQPLQLVHRADRKNLEIALSQASLFGNDTTIEFRMQHRQGHFIWMEMRCRAVPIEDLTLAGEAARSGPDSIQPPSDFEIIGVARDISEARQYQSRLVQARDEAETANRSKSQFLASISHELRTPLNAIIGFSDMMKQEMFGPIGDDHYMDYSRIINDSGTHLLDLINDLLDMSKIEAGKFNLNMERLFFPVVIENSLRLIRLQAENAQVKLAVDLPSSLPHMKADPRACRQILINLLSNAIKFTPPGGTITIGAHAVGDNMEIDVTDTGVGIPPQSLVRLGEPFEQADDGARSDGSHNRSLAGTGLGLALVRSLAELHGGEMTIESRMGEGTSVRVQLPLRRSEMAQDEAQADLPFRRASVIERHMARLEEVEAKELRAAGNAASGECAEEKRVHWPPLRGAA